MPLYEYYCESCDKVFESLRSLRQSEQPSACPACGREAARIMPTSFSAMSWAKGYPQRVPFHQRPVRNVAPKQAKAPVKGKAKAPARKAKR